MFLGCSLPMVGTSNSPLLWRLKQMLPSLFQAYDPDSGVLGQITYQLLPESMYVGAQPATTRALLQEA